ncbi:MAG TPA: DUF2252 family protein [Hanamia sp.]
MPSLFEKIDAYHAGLSPTKVARKYKLLTQNPFRFFRGTNSLFYEDMSRETIYDSPVCWICGDLHLENFGSYKGDNRLVYFDLNDFDECILAPVGWEIARALTSILIAFDALKITDEEAVKACEIFLQKYAKVLADGKPGYIETRTATGIVKKFLNSVEGRSQNELLAKRTVLKKGGLHLNCHKNKQMIIDKKLKKELIGAFKKWMESNNQPPNDYKVLDARFRIAGTGSIGIHRYVFLIEKNGDPNKHMLIDMKQATASSLTPFAGPQPVWESEAQRMVSVQRVMQNITPAQLSTLFFEGESYLMQEMQPTKDRINFKMIQDDFKIVCSVIEDMAMLTASAHLRGIGRKGSCTADELINFGSDPNWQRELLNYATGYKKKVISDYTEFKNYLKSKNHNIN